MEIELSMILLLRRYVLLEVFSMMSACSEHENAILGDRTFEAFKSSINRIKWDLGKKDVIDSMCRSKIQLCSDSVARKRQITPNNKESSLCK